ncbi:hypothetical protein [Clostridium estertheticum]|nr:hypothetical protein [Clostridium estertheticum]
MSRISALKNKISKLNIKTVKMEDTSTLKYIKNINKEIMSL